MAHKREWRQAVPGLVLTGVLLGIALFTLTYARVGAIRGATYSIHLPVSETRGVLRGTDVWIAGKQAGEVAAIRFQPANTDPRERVLLELTILRQYSDLVRQDSEADIRSGGTLLGAPVINIDVGTPDAPALADGDTLRRGAAREMADLMTQLAGLSVEFRQVAANLRGIRESGAGLGERVIELDRDRRRVMELLTREELRQPGPPRQGSLRLLLEDAELGPRFQRIGAALDTLVDALAEPHGTLGRVGHDVPLRQRLDSLAAELAEVNRLLEEGRGTAGRLAHDGALREGISALLREIELLVEDLSERPQRYINF